ncbi:MAG TPA: DNA topoisomerase IV subunit A [Desulfurivibrio alkaliphilus]|uniref:DNA topoisomerase IV subunit A n=1 Tax=Desulfurivibrio alkaliphilus TaxID=427923 RepID=A0A7C2TGV3_9BACT|nr:DNA topoisomerase IV subunit A [Desulfurivibrio alkaliphilus]
METAKYGGLHRLFDENFLDYTSYVIRERAIPDLADGLKPVQRRILQTLHNMDDGRFHKVAGVVGETMKLHPHGDASIFAALVNLANKGFLIERQGNFGNIFTGDSASAARYIECRLSPLAREAMFNKDLTEFVDSYDGRLKEPVSLPAKLPLLLLQGAEGIAVGMATKIMPHNFGELLEAQKKILRDEPFAVYPDFPQGGLLDISAYEDGNGRLRCRARIESKDDKTIIIRDIPYGTTTQSLIESIEKAVRAGKFKILSIDDYTAEEVEIEIKLARGALAEDTVKALYAFTDCEITLSPNLTVIRETTPAVISVSEVLRENTRRLRELLERELQIELERLKERLQAHLLERIFIEERLYKQIEECPTYELVVAAVDEALRPFCEDLVRPVTREDIERLLEIRIKRISRYDIERKKKEIKAVRREIGEVEVSLTDLTGFTIRYLDDLLGRYGKDYPRRTELATFSEVQARQVALSNLSVGYDRENGFLGAQVKAGAENTLACSEYDKLLLIDRTGWYKVINVPEKIFIGHDLLWWGKVTEGIIFNLVYRDGGQNLCYVKRFTTPKFILEKEYRLFEEHRRSEILFLKTGEGINLRAYLSPSPRTRKNREIYRLDDFLLKGVGAIGKRLSARPVRRVEEVSEAVAVKALGAAVVEEEPSPQVPLFGDKK